jgi:hypothetical protein
MPLFVIINFGEPVCRRRRRRFDCCFSARFGSVLFAIMFLGDNYR